MRWLPIFLTFALTVAPAFADQRDPVRHTDRGITDILFSEVEKHLIGEYYGKRHGDRQDEDDDKHGKKKKDKGNGSKQLPPGLAKKDELPPGLAKQLERNGTLPPGLAKRDLPHDLESRLPMLPRTHQRIIVDEDILLIEKATGRILDILFGAAR